MSRWIPALRIARRTVLRSPARSLLIAILVGLPVAGATYADIIARTLSSPERRTQQIIGSADAGIIVTASKRLASDPRRPSEGSAAPGLRRDPAKVDVAALLPAGSRIAETPGLRRIALGQGESISRTQLVTGDVREPLHRFLLRLEEGRAPSAAEVLVSRGLAERLRLLDDGHLRRNATVAVADGPTARVTGLVRNPTCLSCEQLVALPGSVVAKAVTGQSSFAYGPRILTYLVDLPTGIAPDALRRELAASGIALTTRDAIAHPESHPAPEGVSASSPDEVRAFALVALIVVLGLLEVVLLAGTAFAVGARRQVRELGLAAAAGGSPRDIRRIVLAQGLVLGALGAVLGVTFGFAVAIGGRPLWERVADSEIAGWAFGPTEIAGAALVGLLSGLAAAVVPAVGAARMRPVSALAGRFRTAARTRRRGTLIGAGLAAAGAACGLIGGRLLSGDFAAYERALADVARSGRQLNQPEMGGVPLALVVGGAALAVVGVVLLAAPLIGWIATAGARLPLTARLAVRDAERHRHRTGPATGAIVVAVTASVALAFLLAGQFRADELRHVPSLPPNVLAVERGEGSNEMMLRGARRAAEQLPDARVQALAIPLGPRMADSEPGIPEENSRMLSVAQRRDSCRQPGCASVGGDGSLAIGADDALTRMIAGSGFDAAAARALADGRVLVFDDALLDRSGNVSVISHARPVSLPGHVVERGRAFGLLPSALVSEPTARARGWDLGRGFVFVAYGDRATRDDVDAALTAVEQAGAFPIHDEGPDNPENLAMLLIVAAAAFVTLVGVAISVALSAAEGRADLATLAAVGAPPRRRRALMASQALLVGGLGCLLGVGLGTFIAFTARSATGSPNFVVPWTNLAATAIGVPLLAALVAALCTRSRLPMVRRAE